MCWGHLKINCSTVQIYSVHQLYFQKKNDDLWMKNKRIQNQKSTFCLFFVDEISKIIDFFWNELMCIRFLRKWWVEREMNRSPETWLEYNSMNISLCYLEFWKYQKKKIFKCTFTLNYMQYLNKSACIKCLY